MWGNTLTTAQLPPLTMTGRTAWQVKYIITLSRSARFTSQDTWLLLNRTVWLSGSDLDEMTSRRKWRNFFNAVRHVLATKCTLLKLDKPFKNKLGCLLKINKKDCLTKQPIFLLNGEVTYTSSLWLLFNKRAPWLKENDFFLRCSVQYPLHYIGNLLLVLYLYVESLPT